MRPLRPDSVLLKVKPPTAFAGLAIDWVKAEAEEGGRDDHGTNT